MYQNGFRIAGMRITTERLTMVLLAEQTGGGDYGQWGVEKVRSLDFFVDAINQLN